MSLLFADGFDHYTSYADSLTKWSGHYGSNLWMGTYAGGGMWPTGGRFGYGSYYTSQNSSSQGDPGRGHYFITGQKQTLIVGAAFRRNDHSTWGRVFAFEDAYQSTQVCLRLTSDGRIQVYKGYVTGPTLLGTGTATLSLWQWNYIEMKATIDGTNGGVEVRVDGVPDIKLGLYADIPVPLDTTYTANAYADRVAISGNDTAGDIRGAVYDWDDLYICDTAGAVNNDFLGDIRIYSLSPGGPGQYSGWDRGGTDSGQSWSQVSDASSPETARYMTSVESDATDTYAFGDVVSPLDFSPTLSADDYRLAIGAYGDECDTVTPDAAWVLRNIASMTGDGEGYTAVFDAAGDAVTRPFLDSNQEFEMVAHLTGLTSANGMIGPCALDGSGNGIVWALNGPDTGVYSALSYIYSASNVWASDQPALGDHWLRLRRMSAKPGYVRWSGQYSSDGFSWSDWVTCVIASRNITQIGILCAGATGGTQTAKIERFLYGSPFVAVPTSAPTTGTVVGVQHLVYAKKDNAGARSIAPVLRFQTEDAIGSAVGLTTSYAYYRQVLETNPADSDEPFTIDKVNATQFGYKVI